MGPLTRPLSAALLAALVPLCGCQFMSNSQLAAIDAQSRMLVDQNRAQMAEIESLRLRSRTVENQLIQAEEELAQLDERAGGDRKRMAALARERPSQRKSGATATPISQSGQTPPPSAPPAADLSRRFDWLVFDPHTGVSKYDTDVLFDSGQAELGPESRELLDELADLLKAPQASQLRVMVVGHADSKQVAKRPARDRHPDNWHLSTARAVAVVEHLKGAGVPEARLGVAGYSSNQPVSSNEDVAERHLNRRAEIFVVGPETPVVGWSQSSSGVY